MRTKRIFFLIVGLWITWLTMILSTSIFNQQEQQQPLNSGTRGHLLLAEETLEQQRQMFSQLRVTLAEVTANQKGAEMEESGLLARVKNLDLRFQREKERLDRDNSERLLLTGELNDHITDKEIFTHVNQVIEKSDPNGMNEPGDTNLETSSLNVQYSRSETHFDSLEIENANNEFDTSSAMLDDLTDKHVPNQNTILTPEDDPRDAVLGRVTENPNMEKFNSEIDNQVTNEPVNNNHDEPAKDNLLSKDENKKNEPTNANLHIQDILSDQAKNLEADLISQKSDSPTIQPSNPSDVKSRSDSWLQRSQQMINPSFPPLIRTPDHLQAFMDRIKSESANHPTLSPKKKQKALSFEFTAKEKAEKIEAEKILVSTAPLAHSGRDTGACGEWLRDYLLARQSNLKSFNMGGVMSNAIPLATDDVSPKTEQIIRIPYSHFKLFWDNLKPFFSDFPDSSPVNLGSSLFDECLKRRLLPRYLSALRTIDPSLTSADELALSLIGVEWEKTVALNSDKNEDEIEGLYTEVSQNAYVVLLNMFNFLSPVLNEDLFPGAENEFMPVIIRVFERPEIVELVLSRYAKATNIDKALLIFSHSGFNADVFDIIQKIKFCRVKQIIHPYSGFLHSLNFPGFFETEYVLPDHYGNARGYPTVNIRHHFWWLMNFIWDTLPLTASNTSPYFYFFEDDILVSPNIFLLGENLWNQRTTWPDVFAFTFSGNENINGEMMVSTHYKREVINKITLSRRLNVAYAFPRESWNTLKEYKTFFCNHDDQHWDSVVQYLQDKKIIAHGNYAPMFAHVEHVGYTGLNWHFQSNITLQQRDENFDLKCVNVITEAKTETLQYQFQKGSIFKPPPENFRGWGGWNNPFDINLCLLETITNPQEPNHVALVQPDKKWISRCETGFLTYVNITYGPSDINKLLLKSPQAQIAGFRSTIPIIGKLRAGYSIHLMHFEVFPTDWDSLLDIVFVLRSGETITASVNVTERGKVDVDLDSLADPREQTGESSVVDWKTEIAEFRITARESASAIKIGCFGFWMKQIKVK